MEKLRRLLSHPGFWALERREVEPENAQRTWTAAGFVLAPDTDWSVRWSIGLALSPGRVTWFESPDLEVAIGEALAAAERTTEEATWALLGC